MENKEDVWVETSKQRQEEGRLENCRETAQIRGGGGFKTSIESVTQQPHYPID